MPTNLLVLPVLALLASCATLPSLFKRGGDGKVVTTPTGTCVYLAPENGLHPLSACEDPKSYELQIVDRRLSLPKAELQQEFRERLGQLVHASDYPWKTLANATVDFWLTAPAFTPEDASFVAVVRSSGGNFALRLPLEPAQWSASPPVLWLGANDWPSTEERQAGILVVQPKATIPPQRFKDFVARALRDLNKTAGGAPAFLAMEGDGTMLLLHTAPFSEPAVAGRLLRARAARAYIESVHWQPASETMGYKARIFTFPLGAPKHST